MAHPSREEFGRRGCVTVRQVWRFAEKTLERLYVAGRRAGRPRLRTRIRAAVHLAVELRQHAGRQCLRGRTVHAGRTDRRDLRLELADRHGVEVVRGFARRPVLLARLVVAVGLELEVGVGELLVTGERARGELAGGLADAAETLEAVAARRDGAAVVPAR